MSAPHTSKHPRLTNRRPKLWTALAIAVLVIMGGGILSVLQIRERAANARLEDLKAEISQLQQQGKDLDSLIAYLESGDFTEREAREKLGLANPGESVLIVPQGEVSQSAAPNGAQPISKEANNPLLWFRFFFAR